MSGQDEEPRPGNWDRAWNDPPLFNYNQNSATATASVGTSKLNKRIGFPTLGSQTSPPSSNATGDNATPPKNDAPKLYDAGAKPGDKEMPPPPPPRLGSALGTDGCSPTSAQIAPKPAASNECSSVDLDYVIQQLKDSLQNSTMDSKRQQDVLKRLDTMESKWRSGALNEKIHLGMAHLAECLSRNDGVAAERIQRSLNVDWPSLCASWIIGVKHLVLNVKENCKVCEDDSGPKAIEKPL